MDYSFCVQKCKTHPLSVSSDAYMSRRKLSFLHNILVSHQYFLSKYNTTNIETCFKNKKSVIYKKDQKQEKTGNTRMLGPLHSARITRGQFPLSSFHSGHFHRPQMDGLFLCHVASSLAHPHMDVQQTTTPSPWTAEIRNQDTSVCIK